MAFATNLHELIKGMTSMVNDGEYVFSTINNSSVLQRKDIVYAFKEKEGTTLVLEKKRPTN